MRFHLPVLFSLLCVATYAACGSDDEKVRHPAGAGASGNGGASGEGGAGAGGAGVAGVAGNDVTAAGAGGDGGVGLGGAGAGGQGGALPSGEAGAAGAGVGGVEAGGAGGLGGATSGAGGEGGAPEPSVKVVFVSSVAYTGNLGGLAGADAKCAALAAAANIPGTFKAWLSDSTGSPSTRFTRATVDYVLSDRTTVFANGWSDLGSNNHALDMTETGGPPPTSNTACAGLNGGFAAWVSTFADGTPAPDVATGLHTCSDWSSEAVETSTVGLGSPVAANSWIGFCSSGDPTCSKKAPIFCFEQ